MQTETITNHAFQLLQTVFLIIPITIIMLQTIVGYYNQNTSQASGLKIGSAFVAVLIGVLLFGLSTMQIIFILSQNGVAPSVINASLLSLGGLIAVVVAVVLLITELVSTQPEGSSEIEESNEPTGTLSEEQVRKLIEEETGDEVEFEE